MSKSSTIADLQILVLLPSRRRHFPLQSSSNTPLVLSTTRNSPAHCRKEPVSGGGVLTHWWFVRSRSVMAWAPCFSSDTAHTNLSGYPDDSLTFEFIGFLLHQNGAEETLVPLNDLVDRFFVSFPFQDPEILPVLISRISPPVWPSASRTASLSLSIVTLTSCSNFFTNVSTSSTNKKPAVYRQPSLGSFCVCAAIRGC